MSGKLIVIEGLDGSGKATQANILLEQLKRYKNTLKISFPDYNEPSSALVKMYLNKEFGSSPSDVNAYAASSFFAIDRYASFKKFWKNDYEKGSIIISDRYSTSNIVFNLSKLKKSEWDYYMDWLEDYEYNKLELPRPDLVIYLDVPIDVSQKFMSKRYNGDESKKDLHESNVEFLKNCRESALYAAKRNNWCVIDCTQDGIIKSIENIHEMIFKAVKKVVL